MSATVGRGTRAAKPASPPGFEKSREADCRVDIRIDAEGDVNIYNCADGGCAGGHDSPEPSLPPAGPIAPGQCVPLAIGSKPKQSQRAKLDVLLQNTRVSSAIAGAFFQHSRRFLAGQSPANALEADAFSLFESLSPDAKSLLTCSVKSFDVMSEHERNQLFDPAISQDPSTPLDAETLATAFVREIKQRVGTQVFDAVNALEQERPGRNRFFDTTGVESFEIQLPICSVNGLRTNEFVPRLDPGDYLPSELQQHCEPILVDGVAQPDCKVMTANCPGNSREGTCLRVPEVGMGDVVVLEGVNFISVDSKVRITAEPPGTVAREVDAFVVGDIDTPVTEIVDGETRLVRDCRVHDRLTFPVPADLPPGIYSIRVAVPNVSGFPALGDPILSERQYIQVVPPPTARFRITSESLKAGKETSPASFGSDEVRVRVRAYPVTATLTDLALGAEQAFDSPEFGDVDSGDVRAMTAVLFDQLEPMDGLVMTIMGFEIDSETAYRDQVNSFTDAFLAYLKIALAAIAGAFLTGALLVGVKDLLILALANPIVLAIAAALVLVITLVLAAWAPADPIISDQLGFSTIDLAALTSVDSPLPDVAEHMTVDGIKVAVVPIEKTPTQYRERREYRSDAEDSRYEIVLRYNAVA